MIFPYSFEYVESILENSEEVISNSTEAVFLVSDDLFLTLVQNPKFDKCLNWSKIIQNMRPIYDPKIINRILNKTNNDWLSFLKNQKNEGIKFIRFFKGEIDWAVVTQFKGIVFNIKLIDEFKDYLIFTNRVIENRQYLDSRSNGDINLYNLVGNQYRVGEFPNQSQARIDFINLSKAQNIDWSIQLISNFSEYWDWEDLSNNIHIPFNKELIENFKMKWNWEVLSSNTHIPFNIGLIEEFKMKWDWEVLSSNTHIPFSLELIEEFKLKWDWGNLSLNEGIRWTKELVISFNKYINKSAISYNSNVDWYDAIHFLSPKDALDWQALSSNPGLDVRLLTTAYPIVTRQEYDRNTKILDSGKLKFGFSRSLSSNYGIVWTDEILSKYITELDFWMIAIQGRLSTELVIKYAAFFDEIRFVYTTYQKHSDYGTFEVSHFRTGWHNLFCNSNFKPDQNFLDWCFHRKIRIMPSYDPFDSPSFCSPPPSTLINGDGRWITVGNIFGCYTPAI